MRYELEKSVIDLKYQQQIDALQKKSKPNNPLTKRLLAKVQAEWEQAVQRKKEDLEAERQQVREPNTDSLDHLQVKIN